MEGEDLVVLQSPHWLSGCKESLAWDSSCFAAEIRLRADVKEVAVLGLVDQVLLSLGGQLKRSARQLRAEDDSDQLAEETASPSPPPQVVVTSSSSSSCCWQEVKAVLGANLSFQRVLFVLVTAASPSGGLFSLTSSSSSSSSFTSFCQATASTLLRALASSCYTCSSSSQHCSEAAEGVLDLAYLVDLVPVAARLMDEEAQEEARRVDLSLRREDLRVARLMTLLRPFYQRACLALPEPPPHRALASYPLDLPRPSLRIARGTDALRLLLLQARKSYRDHLRSQTAASSLEDCSAQSYQVGFLTQAVVAQLRAWAQEEKACRLDRKRRAAQDRLVALNLFTLQLVLTLHKRFVELPSPSSSTAGRPVISSLSALLTGASASADRKAQDRLVDIFPFLGYREGVLYQGRAVMKVAEEVVQGEVVLTLGHLLFHNRSGLLPSSSCSQLKVLPWKTISTVQVIYRQQQQQQQQVVAGELIPQQQQQQQQQEEQEEEGLCVEDFSGQRVFFLLSDGLAAPQIHRRLHDLAALILHEKLFTMVELPHPAPPPPPAATSTASSGGASENLAVGIEKANGDSIPQRKQQQEQEEEEEEEEEDLSAFLKQFEVEDLPSSFSSSSQVAAVPASSINSASNTTTAVVPPPPAAAAAAALAVKGSNEEEMDRLLREIISPSPPPPATITASSSGVSSASTSEKKKSLAGNIQKFLQQHQHTN